MFPGNIVKLPCAAHRMNAVMKDIFVETEIKVKTNKNGQVTYHAKEFNEELGGFYLRAISLQRVEEINSLNTAIGETNSRLDKCRHLVGSFNHNVELKRELANQQRLLNYKTRTKLQAEAMTRYYYIYTMINSICSNQQAIENINEIESMNEAIIDYVPESTDFEYLNELADLLFNLQEFITVIGASSYPVLSMLYPLGIYSYNKYGHLNHISSYF